MCTYGDIYMVWIQTNANGLITHDSLIFEVCCQNTNWSYMCEEQVSLNRLLQEIQLCSARPAWSQSSTAPPPQPMYDKGARLRRWSRQSRQTLYRNNKKQWKLPMGTGAWVFCKDTELLSRQRACHLNLKKTVRMANIISSVAAAVADDQWLDTRSLPAAHGV